MPGFIYLASPYSSPELSVLNERFLQAEATVAHYLQRGITLYSPIVAHHALAAKFDMPKGVDFWLPHNLCMLERADYLYVLMIPGWKQSKGVMLECEYALDHRIPEFMVSAAGPSCPLSA